MATVAEIAVPADSFPLGTVFTEFPSAKVELERIVPTESAIIPFAWVSGVDAATIEQVVAAFRDRPEVRTARIIDEVSGDYLLRIEWTPDNHGLLQAINDSGVSLLTAVGSPEEWVFEVRSTEPGGIAACREAFRDLDVPLTVTSLHNQTSREGETAVDLTEAQREALVLAFERGYFDTPRRATLTEIGRELGITRQSLADRLRRGHRRLVAATLLGP